jgi:hypothetical protein
MHLHCTSIFGLSEILDNFSVQPIISALLITKDREEDE